MSSVTPTTRPLTGLRARNHAARRQAYLDAARAIVTDDGLDGLTMQRVAAELESGVGSIYRYFASKGALLAAVEHEQLDSLRAVLEAGRRRFDDRGRRAVEGAAPPEADHDTAVALARVVVVGRLWVDAAGPHRAEVDTARRLASDLRRPRPPRRPVSAQVSAPVSEPASTDGSPAPIDAIVDLLREPLDLAVAAGALAPDDNDARVRVLMAAVADAVLTTDVPTFGSQLLDCLLVAWGADGALLDRVTDALADVLADVLTGRRADAPTGAQS